MRINCSDPPDVLVEVLNSYTMTAIEKWIIIHAGNNPDASSGNSETIFQTGSVVLRKCTIEI
jgi:hypothetical protein